MNYKIRRHTLLIHVPLPTQGAQSRKGTAPTTVRAAQRGTRAARRAGGRPAPGPAARAPLAAQLPGVASPPRPSSPSPTQRGAWQHGPRPRAGFPRAWISARSPACRSCDCPQKRPSGPPAKTQQELPTSSRCSLKPFFLNEEVKNHQIQFSSIMTITIITRFLGRIGARVCTETGVAP